MSAPAWSTKPYKGAPPERDIKGFPRPLYPPDAEQYGKPPSSRGPDVVAYTRTICRLGRWGEWDPASWDDGYWSEFAHGSAGADVEHSGVAGVQWQQHLDATGWLGKATFNALCYALVPEGFPHGGEHAMDAVATDLVNEAWSLFEGKPPTASASGSTVRAAALKRAQSQLGYVEGSGNKSKYGAWYGMDGQPWCATFVTWCYELAADDLGTDSPSFVKGSRYAYCPYIVGDARNKRYGLKTTDDPQPGDLVVYDWQGDTVFDHVGVFEKWVSGGDFQAVEGNTSTSSNSNGGQVMRRTRSRYGQGTVFVRVTEP